MLLPAAYVTVKAETTFQIAVRVVLVLIVKVLPAVYVFVPSVHPPKVLEDLDNTDGEPTLPSTVTVVPFTEL